MASRSGRAERRVAAALLGALLALGAPPGSAAAEGAAPLREVARIPLPGVTGRIDHLALDGPGRRLFAAALAADALEVVDLARGRPSARITGLREPQGVLVLSGRDALVVTNGAGASASLLSGPAFAARSEVALRDDPDNLRFDPAQDLVWVGEGQGARGALAAFPAAGGDVRREIPLGGHPESFQLEPDGTRIWANVPALGAVVVVDREAGRVLARHPLPCAANYPMALDAAARRVLVVCRRPARLLALDADSGAVVADVEAPGDADDVFLDPARARVYVSGGAGIVRAYARSAPDRVEPLGDLATGAGARTSLFAGEPARLYVAIPAHGERPAQLLVLEPSD